MGSNRPAVELNRASTQLGADTNREDDRGFERIA